MCGTSKTPSMTTSYVKNYEIIWGHSKFDPSFAVTNCHTWPISYEEYVTGHNNLNCMHHTECNTVMYQASQKLFIYP